MRVTAERRLYLGWNQGRSFGERILSSLPRAEPPPSPRPRHSGTAAQQSTATGGWRRAGVRRIRQAPHTPGKKGRRMWNQGRSFGERICHHVQSLFLAPPHRPATGTARLPNETAEGAEEDQCDPLHRVWSPFAPCQPCKQHGSASPRPMADWKRCRKCLRPL